MSEAVSSGEWIAPDKQIWVCAACGRSGKDRTRLGDSSCFSHAVLCDERTLVIEHGLVKIAQAVPVGITSPLITQK